MAVHLTLAQRVLHPLLLMLMCALFYVPMLRENKSSVFQKKKNATRRLYNVSRITEVPGVVQAVFNIYGFINGDVIYTHVCILVCI